MKKRVHLICNAHIDTIWQWDWQESVSTVISTFQSAVNLAEEFDYIFCHNEAVIYQYVEKYAPALFAQIQKLVREKKWHIMGGWFLQPDCTMPSGESFVRQIRMGQAYFQEKFGVTPTTALNFDSFGHTRGLVQILCKTGYDSYLHMRPSPLDLPLEQEQYLWEGFDGSRVKVNRVIAYGSGLEMSLKKIKNDIEKQPEPVINSLWGVGNHGGGPSRKDLSDISKFIPEMREQEIEVLHSTPEAFFSEIQPTSVVQKSLYTVMPGCYISMSLLKREHIALENELYFSEKICSYAAMKGLISYPKKQLDAAVEDLMTCEFHDVLPGTCIKSGEENALMLLKHGRMEAERAKAEAFFALLREELPAQPGEYPIFVFNPNPYPFTTDVECEFMLADQNWDTSHHSAIRIFDEQGNLLPSQLIKEGSSLNLDWRKRLIFHCTLQPLSMNRFSVRVEYPATVKENMEDRFVYEDEEKYVEIDRETGLLKSFCVHGVEYLHDAFQPVLYQDNADPWAMDPEQLKGLGFDPEPFVLAQNGNNVFGAAKRVGVVEDGEIYRGIEVCFEKSHSKVRVEYRIYKKQPYMDVNVTVFWQEADKLLRLALPLSQQGRYIGQTAFGTDELFMDGRENTAQRFVAMEKDGTCLAVLNNCLYASMFRDDTIHLSLLRGAGYCVHPIPDVPLISDLRYVERMDQCEHRYSFRIGILKTEKLERAAMEFNQKPYALNAFPVKTEESAMPQKPMRVWIENPNVVLTAWKQAERGTDYILRLMNNGVQCVQTTLHVANWELALQFGSYEVKTIRCADGLKVCETLEI